MWTRKGNIYNGEMCVHVITKADVLEVSLVTEPVQKYSVAFVGKGDKEHIEDTYDYSLAQYVITGLNHPFAEWDIEWTKIRHPHSLFLDIKPTDKCPCDSGKLYKDCCLKESGVLRPHAQVYFSEKPIATLPPVVYPARKRE